jgi:hypothetical protein
MDPQDRSGQVPTFSATVSDLDVDPNTLPGTDVTLTDWTGWIDNETNATVTAANAGVTGLVQLDTTTIFDKLNTEQTAYPVMVTDSTKPPVEEAIRHWCFMAGVPAYSVEGDLRHFISKWTNIGRMQDSSTVWRFSGPTTTYKSYIPNTPYDASVTTYTDPLEVNPAQSIVLGMKITHEVHDGLISAYLPNIQSNVTYTLRHVGNSYYLYEKIGSGSTTTLISKAYTLTQTGDAFVMVLVKANAASDKVDLTMRVYEWDATNKVTILSSDTTATAVTSTLRNRPKPYQLDIGWDASLISGKTYASPEYFFVMEKSSLQPEIPRPQISISTTLDSTTAAADLDKQPSYIPGFTGNVWEKLRELCVICDLDITLSESTIVVTPKAAKRLAVTSHAFIPANNWKKSQLSTKAQARDTARTVEVVYRDRANTANLALMWKADSVYSLEKGETKVETVQTDSTFTYVTQPIPVSGVPVPYTWSYSSYVITGNDGYIVDPQWWKDNGGSIKVEMTKKSGEIKITMQAPPVDTVRAPYRISEGVADRPALYICGYGIALKEPVTLPFFTGNSKASQEVGVTFDSPFITKKLLAMNTGHKLSSAFGTAQSEIAFTVSKGDARLSSGATDNGLPLADSIYWNGSYYRAVAQEVNPRGINVSRAERSNDISVLNGEFATGKTIADWNALHAGKTIKDTNVAPLPRFEG